MGGWGEEKGSRVLEQPKVRVPSEASLAVAWEAKANECFQGLVLLYGAMMSLDFSESEADDAALHARVLATAEERMGPDVLAQVKSHIAKIDRIVEEP